MIVFAVMVSSPFQLTCRAPPPVRLFLLGTWYAVVPPKDILSLNLLVSFSLPSLHFGFGCPGDLFFAAGASFFLRLFIRQYFRYIFRSLHYSPKGCANSLQNRLLPTKVSSHCGLVVVWWGCERPGVSQTSHAVFPFQ